MEATDGITVRAVVVVGRGHVAAVEVETIAVVGVVRRGRPIVAVRANVVQLAIAVVAVASSGIKAVAGMSVLWDEH